MIFYTFAWTRVIWRNCLLFTKWLSIFINILSLRERNKVASKARWRIELFKSFSENNNNSSQKGHNQMVEKCLRCKYKSWIFENKGQIHVAIVQNIWNDRKEDSHKRLANDPKMREKTKMCTKVNDYSSFCPFSLSQIIFHTFFCSSSMWEKRERSNISAQCSLLSCFSQKSQLFLPNVSKKSSQMWMRQEEWRRKKEDV